uniref:Sorting nexin/Vps5-like C-terminal domain-containing protein n=1 Tax=Angiostrongylus cantonensis TaxID=6313 RepID=A0A0K0CTU5_ANGCA
MSVRPFEPLKKAEPLKHQLLISKCKAQCAEIATKQREFQDRGRRQIHLIRTFINIVYFEFEDLKRALVKSKEDLEFAKEDMKNGETPARKKALKKANQKYEIQMKVLDDFITGKLADLKSEHVKEIEMIIIEAQTRLLVKSHGKLLASKMHITFLAVTERMGASTN